MLDKKHGSEFKSTFQFYKPKAQKNLTSTNFYSKPLQRNKSQSEYYCKNKTEMSYTLRDLKVDLLVKPHNQKSAQKNGTSYIQDAIIHNNLNQKIASPHLSTKTKDKLSEINSIKKELISSK